MLQAVGLDPRIGSRYLKPGVGYGGSCLPKDVAALVSMGSAANEPMELMRATQEVNELQRRRIIRTLADALDGLGGQRVAVLGLAFKPGTNDVRESPGLQIARELLAAGVDVVTWDAAVTSDLLPAGRRRAVQSSVIRLRRFEGRTPPSSAPSGPRSSTSTSRVRPR